MAKKRKVPPSHQTQEHKPETKRKLAVEEESEEEDDSEEEEDESEEEDEEQEQAAQSESEDSDEPKDDSSKRILVRELLEPLTKPQIIDFLKQASKQDPQILSKIVHVAETDPTYRQIFVHGLGLETTSKDLVEAFEPFGEIEEHNLVMDKRSGRAKRYAFVTFKARSAAEKALKDPQKKIGNRIVSCNLAALGKLKSNAGDAGGGNESNRKIYIGNVGPHASYQGLKAFFESYGEIEDGPSEFDSMTNSFSKGFSVIVFKTMGGYEKAMEEPIKNFYNGMLYCKKFVEKSNDISNSVGVAGNSRELAQSSGGGVNNSGIISANADPNPNPNAYASTVFGKYGHLGLNNANAIINLAGLLNPGIGFQPGNALLAAGYPYYPSSLMGHGFNVPFGNFGVNGGAGSSVLANYGSQGALQGPRASQNVQTQGQLPISNEAMADLDGSEASSSLGMPSLLNC